MTLASVGGFFIDRDQSSADTPALLLWGLEGDGYFDHAALHLTGA